ncbi:MAG: ATP-binding protein [bacterium]
MSEDRPQQLLEHLLGPALLASSEPILVVDVETRILVASLGAGQLLGRHHAELVGQALSQFVFPPPDLERFKLVGKHRNGRPLELELLHRDGRQIPVEVHCDVFEDARNDSHCIVVIHDLSQNENLEQERAARLAKLSLLNQLSEALHGAQLTLEQILQAVLICVTAGQGLRFNRAFLLLIDEQKRELRGETAIGPSNQEEAARIWSDLAIQQFDLFELLIHYDSSLQQKDVVVNELIKRLSVSLDRTEHILVRAMNERQAFRVFTEGVDIPGVEDLRHLLGSAVFAVAPLTTRQGPLGVLVADNSISGKEITDLDLEFLQMFANKSANAIENSRLYHELERRLEDLRKAARRQKEDQELLLRMERLSVMGETSAIVAHELRNPLVAIGGFARTLHRSLADDDPNKQYAAIITEEVDRLERIIHDLLDFIRPQKLLRKPVVLDELVNEVVRRYEDKLAEQNITLALDLQAPRVEVHINPGEIQQVLQNLVLNGMQTMENGGQLTVRTRAQEAGILVELLDDGPGIPDDVLPQLFVPFFTTKTSGSGLGLTISAQIIKAHGGKLTARQRAQGGAAFQFFVPLPKPPGGNDRPLTDSTE